MLGIVLKTYLVLNITHNVRVLGEEAENKTIFPTSAKW